MIHDMCWQEEHDAIDTVIKPGDYSEEQYPRAVAAYYYIKAGESAPLAMHAFLRKCVRKAGTRAAHLKFIKTWGKRVITGRGVGGLHKSGRPMLVPDVMIGELADAIKAGKPAFDDPNSGYKVYYSSWSEVWAKCPKVQDIKRFTDVKCNKTLYKRLRKQYPQLAKCTIHYKTELSAAQKVARVAAATQLLQLTCAQLKAVFWIDAATVYIDPKTRSIICERSLLKDNNTFEHPAVAKGKSQVIRIKYFACVNAMGGAVALVVATGSTGIKEYRTRLGRASYKVGLGLAQLWLCVVGWGVQNIALVLAA